MPGAELLKRGAQTMTVCNSCRYFREVGNGEASHCMRFASSLSVADEMLICVEHVAR